MNLCIKPNSPATVRLIVKRALKTGGSYPIALTPIYKSSGRGKNKEQVLSGYNMKLDPLKVYSALYEDKQFMALDRSIFTSTKNEEGKSEYVDAVLTEVSNALKNTTLSDETIAELKAFKDSDEYVLNQLNTLLSNLPVVTEGNIFSYINLSEKVNSENLNNYLQDEGELFESLADVVVDESKSTKETERSFESSMQWYNEVFDGAIDAYNFLRDSFIKNTLTPNMILDLNNGKIIKPGSDPDNETNIFLLIDQVQTMNKLHSRLFGAPAFPELEGIDKNNYNELGFKDKMRDVGDKWDELIELIADKCLYIERDGKRYKMEGDLLNQAARHYESGTGTLKDEYINFLSFIKLRDFDLMVRDLSDDVIKIAGNRKFDPEAVFYYVPSMNSSEALLFNYDSQPNASDYISGVVKYLYKTFPMYSLDGKQVAGSYLNHIMVWDAISNLEYIDKSNPEQGLVVAIFEYINNPTNNKFTKSVLYSFYKNVLEKQSDKITNNHSSIKSIRAINGSADLVSAFVEQAVGVVKNKLVEIIIDGDNTKLNETHNKQTLGPDIKMQNSVNRHFNENLLILNSIRDSFNVSGRNFQYGELTQDMAISGNNLIDHLRRAYLMLTGLDITAKSTIGVSILDALKIQDPDILTTLTNNIPKLAKFLSTISSNVDAFENQNDKSKSYDIVTVTKDKVTGSSVVKVDMFTSSDLVDSPVIMFKTLAEAYKTAYGEQVKSTMINIEGNGEARYTNYNMAYGMKNNFQRMNKIINSVVGNEQSPFIGNVFVQNPKILKDIVVRSGVKHGDKVRPNTKMNELEHFQQQFYYMYARQLSTGKSPYFDFTNFSDKGTNYMAEVDISLFINPANGRAYEPSEIARRVYDQNKIYIENTFKNSTDKYNALILAFNELFGLDNKISSVNNIKDDIINSSRMLANLVTGNSFPFEVNGKVVNLTGWDAIRQVAGMYNIELIQFLEYQGKTEDGGTPKLLKDGMPDYSTLLPAKAQFQELAKYETFDKFKASMAQVMQQMAAQLEDMGVDKAIPEEIKGYAGTFKGAIQSLYGKTGNEYKLHPMLEAYFWNWNLVSSGIMNSQVGSVFEHKGGTDSDKLVTQTKRNVAFTAQMALNLVGNRYGLDPYMKTAQMGDFTNKIKPVANKPQSVTSLDGASLQTGVTYVRQKAGFGGAYAMTGGIDQKSFASTTDPNTGVFTIIKHAAFTMTPNWIKMTKGSDIDLLDIHKKIYGDVSLKGVDISKSSKLRENGKKINEFENVFYYSDYNVADDTQQIDIMQLDKLEHQGGGVYEITETNITRGGTTTKSVIINNLYDLWQVLGGERSLEKTTDSTFYKAGPQNFKQSMNSFEELNIIQCLSDNGVEELVVNPEYIPAKYRAEYNAFTENGTKPLLLNKALASEVYDEEDAEFLTYLAQQRDKGTLKTFEYQPLKSEAIEMISFGGAIKAGIGMMNNPSTVSKQLSSEYVKELNKKSDGLKQAGNPVSVNGLYGIDKMTSVKISMNNTGRQLNTEHHIDHAELSIPKQMLNATAFGGKTIDYSNRLFEALASLIENNLNDRFKGLNSALQGDLKTYREAILAEATKNIKKQYEQSDVINVASIITESFENVPLNSAFLKNDVVTEIISSLTRDAMKLKFPGLMAVINPTSRMMQIHEVSGGVLPIRQGTSIIYKELKGKTRLTGENYANWVKYNVGRQGVVHTKDGDIDISNLTVEEAMNIQGRELANPGLKILLYKGDEVTEVIASHLDKDFNSPMPADRAASYVARNLDKIKSSINSNGELDINSTTEELVKNEAFVSVFNNAIKKSLMKSAAVVSGVKLKSISAKSSKADKIAAVNAVLNLLYNIGPDGNKSKEGFEKIESLQNSVGSSLFGFLRSELQDDLDRMADGLKPYNGSELFDGYDRFEVIETNGEVIMPAIFRDKLMLEEGFNVASVSHGYYYDKLKANYAVEGKVPGVYSIALASGNGKNVYVYSSREEYNIAAKEGKTLVIDDGIIKNDYGKDIMKVPDDITEDVSVLPNGQIIILLEEVNPENIELLSSSLTEIGLFKDVDFSSVLFGYDMAANEEFLNEKAAKLYNTFKEYLNLTGARIPGQHFQSFQNLEIVDFIEDKDSVCFVPEAVTLYSGSRNQ